MEVQANWLEVIEPQSKSQEPSITEKAGESAPASGRKKPPRVPGAALTLPPMPVSDEASPKGRGTMEVDMRWVEIVDDRERPHPTHRRAPDKATARSKKPIPREEEED